MKLRLFTLLFTMGLAACGSSDGSNPTRTGALSISDKDISQIAMHIHADANASKNSLFVYVYPSWVNKIANITRNLEFDNDSKLLLVINDSQEHVLNRIPYPYTYTEKYTEPESDRPYYYGITLPLKDIKDANFRLKLVRDSDSNTYDTIFTLPMDIEVVSKEPLENSKLNLTRNYSQGKSAKVKWQPAITPPATDYFFFKAINETCSIKENNQIVGTYKKKPDHVSLGAGDPYPLDINKQAESGYLFRYWPKPTAKDKYYDPNNGKNVLEEFIRYKKEADKIDFSARANNLSAYCEGNLILYTYVDLSKKEIKEGVTDLADQVKGDARYHSSTIHITRNRYIPYFFKYQYTEKDKNLGSIEPETAHLMFIRQ